VLNTILMNYACGCFVIVHWFIVGYTFAFGWWPPTSALFLYYTI